VKSASVVKPTRLLLARVVFETGFPAHSLSRDRTPTQLNVTNDRVPANTRAGANRRGHQGVTFPNGDNNNTIWSGETTTQLGVSAHTYVMIPSQPRATDRYMSVFSKNTGAPSPRSNRDPRISLCRTHDPSALSIGTMGTQRLT
jgi:hypothetical protein